MCVSPIQNCFFFSFRWHWRKQLVPVLLNCCTRMKYVETMWFLPLTKHVKGESQRKSWCTHCYLVSFPSKMVDQSSYFNLDKFWIRWAEACSRSLKRTKKGSRMEGFGCFSPSLCGTLKWATSAWYSLLQTPVIHIYAWAMWNKGVLARSLVSQEVPAIPARIADISGVAGVGEGFIWNSFFHCLIYLKIGELVRIIFILQLKGGASVIFWHCGLALTAIPLDIPKVR